MNFRVISGAQTGVDQIALALAKEHGIETGGWMPKGCRTHGGPRPDLLTLYNLREHHSPAYPPRTWANVFDSDLTLWFGVVSPGHTCTKHAARDLGRPFLDNPTVAEIFTMLKKIRPRRPGLMVVNVAGNRFETHPESTAHAKKILVGLFSILRSDGEARKREEPSS